MTFFKTFLASTLGAIVAVIIGLFLFFIVFVGLIGGLLGADADTSSTVLTDATMLRVQLDKPIVERHMKGGTFDIDPATFEPRTSLGLNHILQCIESAAEDDKIKGIYLKAANPQASMSTVEDIRNALVEFKKSGKFIVSYEEAYSQKGYWLSSVADELYMYPQGGMEWMGLNAELMFFKNMLDNVGVEMQVVRGPNNKFKSAVEPFMYDQMSDANREQLTEFISDFWRRMKSDVSAERGISSDQLQMLADSLTIMTAESALKANLLDGLTYPDEVAENLSNKMGGSAVDDLPFLMLSDYRPAKKGSLKGDEVAVVYAVGEIISGEGDDQTIGSDRIAAALRDARLDEDVKAVVLRVNSPGGSALASDVIWRETDLIKQSGKPFVVSMGDVAASGGYYISAFADSLFANATTVTGSIGVFGTLPNAQELLEDKIGVTFDNVKTAAHADLISLADPLDDFEYKAIQKSVVEIYDTFVNIVAEGRSMTYEQVDAIGQGRVWSGEDALRIGLVDELGNLEDAIACAGRLAGLSEFKTKELPRPVDPFEEFMKELGGQKALSPEALLGEDFPEFYELYKQVRSAQRVQGVQARLPFLYKLK